MHKQIQLNPMAFFQQSVLDKYLRALDSEKLQASYAQFKQTFHNPAIQENIRQSKEEQYQRGFLRDLFVNVLGYRLNPQENFNLTTEYKNVKDSKKADGAILINEQVKAVIELKGTDTTDLNKVEDQAFGYKNNQPDCTYVIISNFEKLRFYIDNAIEYIEFNLFTLTENDFALLWLCLAYENIATDLPKKIKTASVSREDEITQKLYKDYSQFKQELFRNIVKLNPNYNELELFKKSQKLLDRFLFIFFAEDRNLLPPNSMRKILHQWKQLQELDAYTPLYNRFKKYFGYMNTGFKGKTDDVFAYNGGLFKPDAILDAIVIDDAVLYEHTLNLSNYDYASEVDVNILGHIFEHSLNEIEEVKANLEGKEIDKAQTKRKKDGIYYTPKYITKYIVENTVGKLCEEKKQELGIVEEEYLTERKRNIVTKKPLLEKLESYRDWLLKLTICDPACGSGAFLNQTLDFLIKEHHYIDELIAKITGASIVFEDVEISILENNLFGVDLNEESVEIAKLSLWLRTARPQRKLNDLNNNIKCGNSLIDDPEVAGDKAFNWKAEFPHVFANGGFDVVIGNPPYVDIKNLPPIDVKYYFQKYSTTENRINLYSIFIEKGLSILNDRGKLSYINPNSMLINSSYFKLRKLLINNLSKIIKLPDDVFAAAKVETIIFELDKNYKDGIVNVIVYKKDEAITEIDKNRIVEFYKSDWIKNENLNFNIYSSPKTTAILNKIENSDSKLLGDIADFTLG
ncbi:MAG: Eco57I restriction-modification methylase domain-containing protein, partial [Petrimonas sp.]